MNNDPLTEKIIGACFTVSNELGSGFLEKVYQNALLLELRSIGLDTQVEVPLHVRYKGKVVGEYFADILVENQVILELKAVNHLEQKHKAQILNYLHATGIKLGLLINFGTPRIQISRVIN